MKIDGFSQTYCTDIDCEAVINTGIDAVEGPPPIIDALNKQLGGHEGNDTVRISSMHTYACYSIVTSCILIVKIILFLHIHT